jgi:hypothetical protein
MLACVSSYIGKYRKRLTVYGLPQAKKQDPKGKFIKLKKFCDKSLVVRHLPTPVRA